MDEGFDRGLRGPFRPDGGCSCCCADEKAKTCRGALRRSIPGAIREKAAVVVEVKE